MKTYVIADTTYNHEGDIGYLMRMVDDLAGIKTDAVKFHLLFNLDDYMVRTHPAYEKIKGLLIAPEKWDHIIDHATGQGLDVVLLCDDVASLRYAMRRKDIKEIELHSSSITDFNLFNIASGYDGGVMLGVGGATDDEIRTALSLFDYPVTLMYGFNGWSTDPVDINMKRMVDIHSRFCCPVGYADHTFWDHPNNVFISCAAAFNGFSILEKHFTLDPGVERVDFKESVGKKQMVEIQRLLPLAYDSYGTGFMSKAEIGFASKIRKVDGLRR
jgi:N,N'-diacetyllegionaminate synthase